MNANALVLSYIQCTYLLHQLTSPHLIPSLWIPQPLPRNAVQRRADSCNCSSAKQTTSTRSHRHRPHPSALLPPAAAAVTYIAGT